MEHELHHVPDRLLRDLARAPVVPESEIRLFMETARGSVHERQAGGVVLENELRPREKQVLEHVSHGMTVPMIAESLHLIPATVELYARTARYRLGAKNTAHAACIALRRGLIN